MTKSRIFRISNACILFCLAAFHPCNNFVQSQQQPEPCPSDPSVTGFTSIKDLNFFMMNIWIFINQGIELEPPFFFQLCPNTTFSDDYIFPVLNDTWIICGSDGSSSNNCTLNNETHVVMIPHEYPGAATVTMEHVNFFGLTLTQSNDVSVAAYSSPEAWGYFYDCHWIVSMF